MRKTKLAQYDFQDPISAAALERTLDYAHQNAGIYEMIVDPHPGCRIYKRGRKTQYQKPEFTAEFRKHNVPVMAKAVPVTKRERKEFPNTDPNSFTSIKFYGMSKMAQNIANELAEYIQRFHSKQPLV